MIPGELADAVEQCRGDGFAVDRQRVACPGCEDQWLMPPNPRPEHGRWLHRFRTDHREHTPVPTPREFRLLVDPLPTGAQVERLLREYVDLGLAVSPRRGIGIVLARRPAASLAEAIVSVVGDVEGLGLCPIRVDHDDPAVPAVVEAANLALLLRALGPDVERRDVIRRLATP